MKKGWDIPFSYYIKIKWSTRVSYSFNSASDYSSNVWKVSKYGIFPVHIFLYSNWIRSNYRPMHFWCHGTTLKKIFSIEKLNWTWNKETNFNKLGRFFSRVFQIALRGRWWGWEIDYARGHESPMQVTADQHISHPLPLINAPMHLNILRKMGWTNLSLARLKEFSLEKRGTF